MKKITTALVLIFLLNITVAYADPIDVLINPHTFSDVDSTDVEILYLAELGIVEGRPDLTVNSEGALNRAESLTVFARLFELDAVYDPNCTFPDIEPNVWYAPYVSAMCNEGLVQGYPDGTFKANNQLNRAEAMAILVRGLDVDLQPPYQDLPPDVEPDVWYAPYASYVVGRNLTPLRNGMFDGGHSYTRGDLFINVYRLKRLEELQQANYSTDLDPQVIESTEGKSDEVEFTVTGNQNNAVSYFNNTNVDFDEFIDPPMPLTYKEAAYYLTLQYRDALEGMLHPDLDDKIKNILIKINSFEDYDYTEAVNSFYNEFGLNLDGEDINSNITQNELDNVIASVKETAINYGKDVESIGIFFNVVNPTTIEVTFDERGCGTSRIDYTTFDSYRYSLDTDYWPDLAQREPIVRLTNIEGSEVQIDWQSFDENSIYLLDENNEPTGHVKEGFAKLTVKLEEELDAGTDYVLELNPILLHRYVKDGDNYYTCDNFDLEYLPASEFEFNGNSALEFAYDTNQDSNVAGVVARSQVNWTRGWQLPLSAILYDQEGELISTSEGFAWNIVEGNGEIVVDEFGASYHSTNDDTNVVLQVTYGDFTDTMTVKIVDNMGI